MKLLEENQNAKNKKAKNAQAYCSGIKNQSLLSNKSRKDSIFEKMAE